MMPALFLLLFLAAPDPETAPKVDLTRYAGLWHEIARTPNWFQNKCASNVRAEYTLQPNGNITVLNSCTKSDGKPSTAKGTAKLDGKDGSNAKLKVTFFWPFYGKYWILALDENYQWAVVGEPNRKYLWFLSRKPQIDDALYAKLLQIADARGYDTSRITKTKQ
jgi:apolipoprotein D and lipocalin family protein